MIESSIAGGVRCYRDRSNEALALETGGVVGEKLQGEAGTGYAVVSSRDGDAAGADAGGGKYGEVLEVVCTDVGVARIVGSGAVVAEVDADAEVAEDGVALDAVAGAGEYVYS